MTFHFLNIGDALGAVALWNDIRKAWKGGETGKTTEIIHQQLPNFLGLGRKDEQLFEPLRMLMKDDERRLIDLVIGEMEDYEENIFRLTVTGMPCGNELADKSVTDSKGKTTTTKEVKSWEFTEKDLRVKYLMGIANEVSQIARGQGLSGQQAAELVVQGMRKRRLITRSPAVQAAYEFLGDAAKVNEAAGKIPPQPGDLSLNPFRGIGTTFKTFKKLFF